MYLREIQGSENVMHVIRKNIKISQHSLQLIKK